YAGQQNVRKTIVVIVADRDTHAVHFEIETSLAGDISEGSIAIVVIEAQGAAGALVLGPVHSVDQQNVLPTIGVVIEKGTTGTQRLGKRLSAESSTVVVEFKPRLFSDVYEAKAGVGIDSTRKWVKPGRNCQP